MALTEHDIKEVVREAVQETLIQIGIDPSDMTEVQKDHAFLRRWRTTTEKVSLRTTMLILTIIVGGVVSAVWAAIKR